MDKVNLKWEDDTLNISYVSGPKNPLKKLKTKRSTPLYINCYLYIFQDQKLHIN